MRRNRVPTDGASESIKKLTRIFIESVFSPLGSSSFSVTEGTFYTAKLGRTKLFDCAPSIMIVRPG